VKKQREQGTHVSEWSKDPIRNRYDPNGNLCRLADLNERAAAANDELDLMLSALVAERVGSVKLRSPHRPSRCDYVRYPHLSTP
jgi:hypothetical protein